MERVGSLVLSSSHVRLLKCRMDGQTVAVHTLTALEEQSVCSAWATHNTVCHAAGHAGKHRLVLMSQTHYLSPLLQLNPKP